jgi:hypothetical protein
MTSNGTTAAPGPWLTARRWWQLAATALAVVAVVVLLVVPLYSSDSATVSSDGTAVTDSAQQTLIAVNGAGVVVALLVPLLLAALPLPWRGQAWQVTSIVSAAALLVFCVLGGFSIGFAFVPAAICAVVGAFVPVRAVQPAVG